MLLPAEIETRTSVPALRAKVAKRLLAEYNLNQKQAADVLGVTQAAISNYFRGTRGTLFEIDGDERINALIDEICTMMVDKRTTNEIISKFNEACTIIRTERMLCDVHKQLEPSLDIDSCHVCDEPTDGTQSINLKIH